MAAFALILNSSPVKNQVARELEKVAEPKTKLPFAWYVGMAAIVAMFVLVAVGSIMVIRGSAKPQPANVSAIRVNSLTSN